jgi:serine/threonine-protein kinase
VESRKWGPLRIETELGSGAFGTVYRAFDTNLQRSVALKIYRERPGELAINLESLKTEGRLLARVRHENVAVVYGVEQQGDEVGLWMELIDGRTLAQEIRTSGPVGFREAALVGQDLCRALAAVHRQGLIHRDVKPQNVMRERGGRVVLMDFGIGRDLRDASSPVETSGTPLYMAPELFRGAAATPSSDVYSLGVLVFHLVTGSYPVVAETRSALEQMHLRGQRKYLRDIRPDLPDGFVQVIERACAPEPSTRYGSAGEMEAALAGVLGLRTASDDRDPARFRFSSRLAWATAIAASAVLALGLFAASYLAKRDGPAIVSNDLGTGGGVASPLAGQYEIQASFFRADTNGSVRLAPGDRVKPGDGLFIELQSSRPVHVYIVNQDERGESYLLFPLPNQTATNPLTAGTSHRLPSRETSWQVTSAGGREHFLIVASPEPMVPLESVLAALPKAAPGRQIVTAAPVSGEVMGQLRGIGGIATTEERGGLPGDLSRSAVMLGTGPESIAGAWMRRFTLENPGR